MATCMSICCPPTLTRSPAGASLIHEFAEKVVSLGGTVGAEHGLGKRKRDFLTLQWTPGEIEQMRAIKDASIRTGCLGAGRCSRRLHPEWNALALPHGRSDRTDAVDACLNPIAGLYARPFGQPVEIRSPGYRVKKSE